MPRVSALLALLAGLTSALGFAPLEWWPVTLAAFALWLWLVHNAPSLRTALWHSWLFGVGHFTIGNNWIQHAFDFQDRMPPALGYVAVVGLALYLAIYPMLAGGLAWRLGRRGERPNLGFVLIAGAGWIATEYLRAVVMTGYPWNPVGAIWVPTPVRHLAAFTGTYALSGLTVAASAAILLPRSRVRYAVLVGLAVLMAGFAWMERPATPAVSSDAPRVRVVQPNAGKEEQNQPGYDDRVFDTLVALSGRPGPVPRLVIWPEGAVNPPLEDGYPPEWYPQSPFLLRTRIAETLGSRDVALVGGTALFFDRQRRIEGAGNSVFAITADARIIGRYDKAHLVPGGEYLPLRSILQPLGLSRLVMGDVDFRPGPGPATIAVPGFGDAGMQICYEIIFSGQVVDPTHRPRFIVNPSVDSWYGSWGPPQHLAQARLRAVEEGLPVLRSTTTGISAVIDASGALVATIPMRRADAIEVPIPAPHPPTPFARLGNWLALAMIVLLSGLAIAIRRAAR
ncbi:acyltransferase [Sphingomonas sp. Leaf407]|uniref:apolipoprotein N-acyltransferase n=1 Tax=unclassified Sphingomonas TaxID=196159 RepID=UPI00070092DB|nr:MULTISPECIES: apolipoprotein N-acyltransferase [unclassified Sphingomonas]KQN40575.1 acyltransferase [Sphingomonas sp. Leaf42]KQT29930.1 acyltransferase [Sphingomonas sp. Leaf407]